AAPVPRTYMQSRAHRRQEENHAVFDRAPGEEFGHLPPAASEGKYVAVRKSIEHEYASFSGETLRNRRCLRREYSGDSPGGVAVVLTPNVATGRLGMPGPSHKDGSNAHCMTETTAYLLH